MARFTHRFPSATLMAVLLAGAVVFTPDRQADAAGCSVSNVRTAVIFGVLQAAVDAASEGDTLRVKGTCVGTTMIRLTSLHLRGVPTAAQPAPALDGGGQGRALILSSARVVLRDLIVSHGKARYGGGIRLRYSRLSLKGDTSIAGNTAEMEGGGVYLGTDCLLTLQDSVTITGNIAGYGGGVANVFGTLTMTGSASVTGNTAEHDGGGIMNDEAILALSGAASVTGNEAGESGGGIWNRRRSWLGLRDSTTVTGNVAGKGGGGIANVRRSTLVLSDSASVTGNTAGTIGGGVRNTTGTVSVCSDLVAISPNDPDDPPPTLPCA